MPVPAEQRDIDQAGNRFFLGVATSLAGSAWVSRLADEREVLEIAQRCGVADVLARILAGRGIDPDGVDPFLNPSLRGGLPNPSTLVDMDTCVDHIIRALTESQAIAVFGDYDVDGATSAALLKRYFRALGHDLVIYVPDRLEEGYGPNAPALLKLKDGGVDLVITVDCGTLAFEPLSRAKDAGLDVIVLDHHQAEPLLPDGIGVVNPNRLDDASGLGVLAAVGVVFMFLVALNRGLRDAGWFDANGIDEPNLLQWLDLVALGTICDVVPLTGVNRVLTAQGLKVMAQQRNVGLKALSDVASIKTDPGTYHAGFLLGPRVNAGGRVGEAGAGATLLSTDDWAEARVLAEKLDRFNLERRTIEALVLEQAMEQAHALPGGAPVVVVASEGWHPGVVGIVASRLKDKFGVPSIVIGAENGVGKGSGRSIPGVDLGNAVIAAHQAGLLINGGGHAMAAGLTLDMERLAELKSFLADRMAEAVVANGGQHRRKIDAVISVAGANGELMALIEQAGPFGAGNPEPVLAIPSARIAFADVVGQGHVRCTLTDLEGNRLKAIAFRAQESGVGGALLASDKKPLHLVGKLRWDDWAGEGRVQFQIDDAALAQRS